MGCKTPLYFLFSGTESGARQGHFVIFFRVNCSLHPRPPFGGFDPSSIPFPLSLSLSRKRGGGRCSGLTLPAPCPPPSIKREAHTSHLKKCTERDIHSFHKIISYPCTFDHSIFGLSRNLFACFLVIINVRKGGSEAGLCFFRTGG